MASGRHALSGIKEVKMIRVDHSAIYLENEKLSDELSYNIDHLQRRRYRQFMAREAEISELKKISGNTGQDSIINRGKSAIKDRGQTSGKSSRKTKSHSTKGDRPSGNDPFSETQEPPPRSVPGSEVSSETPGIAGSEPQTPAARADNTKDTSGRPRSVVVKIPSPETHSMDKVDSGGGMNSRRRLNGQSSFFDSDSDSDGNVVTPSPFVRPPARKSAPPLNRGQVNRNQGYGQSNRQGEPHGVPRRMTRLEEMMDEMRMERYPHHWYTNVIEASDVSVKSRGTKSKDLSRSKPTSHTRSGSRLRRPHTSIGQGASQGRSAGTEQGRIHFLPTPEDPVCSVVICQRPPTTKTRRQLLQIANQSNSDGLRTRPMSALQRRLAVTQEEKEALEVRVRDFVQSLEEVKKRRLRKRDILLDDLYSPAAERDTSQTFPTANLTVDNNDGSTGVLLV